MLLTGLIGIPLRRFFNLHYAFIIIVYLLCLPLHALPTLYLRHPQRSILRNNYPFPSQRRLILETAVPSAIPTVRPRRQKSSNTTPSTLLHVRRLPNVHERFPSFVPNDMRFNKPSSPLGCYFFGDGVVDGFRTPLPSWISGNTTFYTVPNETEYKDLPPQFHSHIFAKDVFSVSLPVQPQKRYRIVLGFAEVYDIACRSRRMDGYRMFRVSVGGSSEVVDVVKEKGCASPLFLSFENVTVSNSVKSLRVLFESITQSAMLSTLCYFRAEKEFSSFNPEPKQSSGLASVVPSPQVENDDLDIEPPNNLFSCVHFGLRHVDGYKLYDNTLLHGDAHVRKHISSGYRNLPKVYHSSVLGASFSYDLNAPSSSHYTVILGFAETSYKICSRSSSDGSSEKTIRIFQASVGAVTHVVNVKRSVGCYKPFHVTFSNVTSVHSVVNVKLKSVSEKAMLSFICYTNHSVGFNHLSTPSPSTSAPLSKPKDVSKLRNQQKPPALDNSELQYECFQFGTLSVSGFREVPLTTIGRGLQIYSNPTVSISPASVYNDVYKSHLFGTKFSVLISSNSTAPKSVVLGFAEIFGDNCEAEARVFKFRAGSSSRIVDLYDQIGCLQSFNVRVDGIPASSDGSIEVVFSTFKDHAMISGLCVRNDESSSPLRQYVVGEFPLPTSASVVRALTSVDHTDFQVSVENLDVPSVSPSSSPVPVTIGDDGGESNGGAVTSSPSIVAQMSSQPEPQRSPTVIIDPSVIPDPTKQPPIAASPSEGSSVASEGPLVSSTPLVTITASSAPQASPADASLDPSPMLVASVSASPSRGIDSPASPKASFGISPSRFPDSSFLFIPSSPTPQIESTASPFVSTSVAPTPNIALPSSADADSSSSPINVPTPSQSLSLAPDPATSISPVSSAAQSRAVEPPVIIIPTSPSQLPTSSSSLISSPMFSPPIIIDASPMASPSASSSTAASSQDPLITGTPILVPSTSVLVPSTRSVASSSPIILIVPPNPQPATSSPLPSSLPSPPPSLSAFPVSSPSQSIIIAPSSAPMTPSASASLSMKPSISTLIMSPSPIPSSDFSEPPGPSQIPEPSTSTDSGGPILLPPISSPDIEESPGFAYISPPVVIPVPDSDETGIVQGPDGSSNSTLSDEEGNAPSIIAEGKWKELMGTGPSSRAFSIIMGILGTLLVLALLLCLFFAIFKGAPPSYSYASQYSPRGPNGQGASERSAATDSVPITAGGQPSGYGTEGVSEGVAPAGIGGGDGEAAEVEEAVRFEMPGDGSLGGNGTAAFALESDGVASRGTFRPSSGYTRRFDGKGEVGGKRFSAVMLGSAQRQDEDSMSFTPEPDTYSMGGYGSETASISQDAKGWVVVDKDIEGESMTPSANEESNIEAGLEVGRHGRVPASEDEGYGSEEYGVDMEMETRSADGNGMTMGSVDEQDWNEYKSTQPDEAGEGDDTMGDDTIENSFDAIGKAISRSMALEKNDKVLVPRNEADGDRDTSRRIEERESVLMNEVRILSQGQGTSSGNGGSTSGGEDCLSNGSQPAATPYERDMTLDEEAIEDELDYGSRTGLPRQTGRMSRRFVVDRTRIGRHTQFENGSSEGPWPSWWTESKQRRVTEYGDMGGNENREAVDGKENDSWQSYGNSGENGHGSSRLTKEVRKDRIGLHQTGRLMGNSDWQQNSSRGGRSGQGVMLDLEHDYQRKRHEQTTVTNQMNSFSSIPPQVEELGGFDAHMSPV